MQLEEEINGGPTILRIQAPRLDASKASALREVLVELIAGGQQWIILDLEEVEFMDSAAMSALITAVKKLGPFGTISVASLRFPVARLFSVTRMDRVFPITATVDEAILSLAA
jgi:anti-sigma B factor antagonist